jgi:hypothetical protein
MLVTKILCVEHVNNFTFQHRILNESIILNMLKHELFLTSVFFIYHLKAIGVLPVLNKRKCNLSNIYLPPVRISIGTVSS